MMNKMRIKNNGKKYIYQIKDVAHHEFSFIFIRKIKSKNIYMDILFKYIIHGKKKKKKIR